MTRSLRTLLPTTLAMAVVAALVGCGSRSAPDPAHPNILFVLVDTLRADALHSYGNPRPLTPHLDELAREGWLFERVVAPSSWTKTSMASVFTSRDPSRHGVRSPKHRLSRRHTTLASALRDAGYRTIGLHSNPWLDPRFGFDTGFDEYVTRKKASAGELFGRALELVRDAGDQPTFLYVHLMDAHAPYHPSRRFFDEPPLRLPDRGPVPDVLLENLYRYENVEITPEVEARVHRLYEAGVEETDAAIADALEDLRQTGFLDGAIVVVTSDHGEGFGEHGTRTHGWNLYPEVIEVPLIIQAPGRLPPGVRIEAQVRSVDVAPTVLALAGVEPPASFEGRSLVGPEGQLPEARVAVAAVGLTDRLKDRDYVAVVSADHLYVRDRKSGAVEFYDLARDPGALHDLGPDHPLVPGYAALEGGGDATRLENVELDPALRAELRTLGYLVDDDDEGEGDAGSP